MRTAALFSYDAAGKRTLLTDSPDVAVVKARFKSELEKNKDGNDKMVLLEMWDSSSGYTKRKRWNSAAEMKAIAAAAKREAELTEKAAQEKAKQAKDAEKAKADAQAAHLKRSQEETKKRTKDLEKLGGFKDRKDQ